MNSEDMLKFYSKCWHDLRSVLVDIMCDKPSDCAFAENMFNVMILIEHIFEMRK